jgi:hypothetical protein
VLKQPTIVAKPPVTALTQLVNRDRLEGIQRIGQQRLLGEYVPPPRLCQRHIGADTRIDLLNGPAPTQDADNDVQQFRLGTMPYRLQWQLQRTEDRRQKVSAPKTVAEHAKGGKVRRCVLRNQSYPCGHGHPSFAFTQDACLSFYFNC